MSLDSIRCPLKGSPSAAAAVLDFISAALFARPEARHKGELQVSARNKFLILLSIICVIALAYYYFSTPSNRDLDAYRHRGFQPGHRQPAESGTHLRSCWWTRAHL